MTKICSKCNIEKDLTYFSKDNRSKDNLQSWCKECSYKKKPKGRPLKNKNVDIDPYYLRRNSK